jgi:predicted nucleotidyltransferase
MEQTKNPFANVLGSLAEHDLLPAACLSVFVVGSLSRGWGHARSDIDLVVVTPQGRHSPTSSVQSVGFPTSLIGVEALTIDGRRCEIKYWQPEQVAECMEKASWDAFERGEAEKEFNTSQYAFLERMCHAAVIHGADWFEVQRAAVLDSALNSIIAGDRLSRADSALEDMEGFIEIGDSLSAVMPARIAFGYAVDALNATHGEAGLERKWRPKRVGLLNHPSLPLDRYWDIELGVNLDRHDPRSWLDEVAWTCGRTFLDTMIGRAPAATP